ncbi:MAG TPA: glycosyltransferase family 9 protein [Alphaproteobacteria bacterium]|nr:glycosyltransferase family 9 protein [Alphaproteobacteria bacterium]
MRLVDALAAAIPAPAAKRGVLVLRLFGIGDALLFRAAVERYAEAIGVPLDELAILGSTAWAPVAPLFYRGLRVELIDERRMARDPLYRLATLVRIRRRGYRIALCGMRYRQPHVVDSLMVASGAVERIAIEPRANPKYDGMFAHYRPKLTRIVPSPDAPPGFAQGAVPMRRRHELEHQATFLSALAGRPIELALPTLAPPPGPTPLLEPGERALLLNLGASHGPRRWPLAFHLELARRALAAGVSAIFLGGPTERPLAYEVATAIAGLDASTGRARAIAAIDTLDFADVARLVAAAAATVSSDTGIGHLAILMGRPAALIVGGGHFGPFMPYPPALEPKGARFVHVPMACYHCDWSCSVMAPGAATFPCIERVAPERIWAALLELGLLDAPADGASTAARAP